MFRDDTPQLPGNLLAHGPEPACSAGTQISGAKRQQGPPVLPSHTPEHGAEPSAAAAAADRFVTNGETKLAGLVDLSLLKSKERDALEKVRRRARILPRCSLTPLVELSISAS